ncbi:MAG TPA: hypothetical protein VFA28_11290 [Bryobacteraceae bacterium]|jgi:hypothetical protein|nr:hypothetical protein [Bryobacteraceae bacterium]
MNSPASVRARLLNLSKQTGEDFQALLNRYAIERFLYRLGTGDQSDDFVLKGRGLRSTNWTKKAKSEAARMAQADRSSHWLRKPKAKAVTTTVTNEGRFASLSSWQMHSDPFRLPQLFHGYLCRLTKPAQ